MPIQPRPRILPAPPADQAPTMRLLISLRLPKLLLLSPGRRAPAAPCLRGCKFPLTLPRQPDAPAGYVLACAAVCVRRSRAPRQGSLRAPAVPLSAIRFDRKFENENRQKTSSPKSFQPPRQLPQEPVPEAPNPFKLSCSNSL